MLLKQVFKTYTGCDKRVRFENAYSKTHRFFVVRMYKGEIDKEKLDRTREKDYTYQMKVSLKQLQR